jgi:hypothetical protein
MAGTIRCLQEFRLRFGRSSMVTRITPGLAFLTYM